MCICCAASSIRCTSPLLDFKLDAKLCGGRVPSRSCGSFVAPSAMHKSALGTGLHVQRREGSSVACAARLRAPSAGAARPDLRVSICERAARSHSVRHATRKAVDGMPEAARSVLRVQCHRGGGESMFVRCTASSIRCTSPLLDFSSMGIWVVEERRSERAGPFPASQSSRGTARGIRVTSNTEKAHR